MGISTGYTRPDGTDIGMNLVEKSYLLDRYPELADTFRYGGLWAWGDGSNLAGYPGKLGNNEWNKVSSPIQNVSGGGNWKSILVGSSNHSGAIKTNGTLWMWGPNTYGQIGSGGTSTWRSNEAIGTNTNWKQLAGGFYHTAAIKTDGTLWTWGRNNYGQLGTNNITSYSSPVQTVAGGTNWKQVICGWYHTVALKTDGTIWSWGLNSSGQLGDNTIDSKSSPVQTISGDTNWTQISATTTGTYAIKSDGTLWLWGTINSDSILTSSPVQIASGGTDWKKLSNSGGLFAAIKNDGSVVVSPDGSLSSLIPGTNWKYIGGGTQHFVGIKTDGTLWTWGYNTSGELGDGTRNTTATPIQTVAGGSNWTFATANKNATFAIRDEFSDLL